MKAIVGLGIVLAGLIALIVYLPAAIIREATWAEDETLPSWMGTVRGRRMRLRLVLAVLGSLALAVTAMALWDG